jgi:hypothetical protein
MGYLIYVVNLELDHSTLEARVTEEDGKLYFSYNWGDMRKYWDITKDMIGLHGTDVIDRLRKAMDTLTQEGIELEVVDRSNPNWSWGVGKDGKSLASLHERKSIFYYHLNNFLCHAMNYASDFFIGGDEIRPSVTYLNKKYTVKNWRTH